MDDKVQSRKENSPKQKLRSLKMLSGREKRPDVGILEVGSEAAIL